MKKIFVIFLLSFHAYSQTSTNSSGLKCSSNGTMIYHIPGAFTSGDDQATAKSELSNNILPANPNKFDLKQQDADVIPILSQGYIQDKLAFKMMRLGDTYGTDAANTAWLTLGVSELGFSLAGDLETVAVAAGNMTKLSSVKSIGVVGNLKKINIDKTKELVSSMINLSSQGISLSNSSGSALNVLKTLTSEDNTNITTRLGKLLGMLPALEGNPIGIKNVMNFASLQILEGGWYSHVNQYRGTALASYFTTQNNIDNIATMVEGQLDANKKVILSVHREGNELASRAIAQIQASGTPDQVSKLSKYVSVLSTSPTSNPYSTKYLPMKNSLDVNVAGAQFIAPNYVLKNKTGRDTNNFFTKIIDKITLEPLGSSFLDYYLSQDRTASLGNGPYLTMRDQFIQQLQNSAESLEDNCSIPIIQIDSPNIVQDAGYDNYYVDGYAGLDRVINVVASDTAAYPNQLDGLETTYEWSFNQFDVERYFAQDDANMFYNNSSTLNNINLTIPFNHYLYNVVVTATNKYGKKTTKNMSFNNLNHRAPIAKSISTYCIDSVNHQYIALIMIDSDSLLPYGRSAAIPLKIQNPYVFNELTMGHYWYNSYQFKDWGLFSNVLQFTNPCVP